jgi:hypothetical protein
MKTDKNIRFESKEESSERRIREALERTGHERLLFFFQLCEEMQFFLKTNQTQTGVKTTLY